jgi:hypothetical protein
MCFRPSRVKLCPCPFIATGEGYFVDLSILLLYQSGTRMDLISFVNSCGHKFFYTETVANALEDTRYLQILSSAILPYGGCMKKYFRFVESGMCSKKKEEITNSIHEEQMRRNLLTIMEATEIRGRLSNNNFESLIVSDMRHYNKLPLKKFGMEEHIELLPFSKMI